MFEVIVSFGLAASLGFSAYTWHKLEDLKGELFTPGEGKRRIEPINQWSNYLGENDGDGL